MRFLFTFHILLLSVAIQAQSFSIEKDTCIEYAEPTYAVTCFNVLHNLTDSTIRIRWHGVREDLPAGWQWSFSDLTISYLPGFDSHFFDLDDSMSSNIDISFWTDTNGGFGEVEVLFYIDGDSANTMQSAIYRLNAYPLNIAEPGTDEISVYPNPMKNTLFIDGVTGGVVQLMDMQGQLMLEHNFNTSEVDVSELNSGVYFLLLNGRVVQRVVVR